MTSLKRHTAKNLTEFLNIAISINKDCDERAWFRGHTSAAYRLTPSVLRDTVPLRDQFGRPLKGDERLVSSGNTVAGLSSERMLDEFKRKSRPFLTSIPPNDFEWLFLMQHFGVPTRLLDWTTNALVALYFATETLTPRSSGLESTAAEQFMDGDETREDGFAVFAIDPHQINFLAHKKNYAIDICQDEDWSHYERPMESNDAAYHPVCILAPHNNPRIRAQSGTFTLHGSNIWPLDYYDHLRPAIHKIFISYEHIQTFQDQLIGIGMTTSYIYPDLEGLSKEITLREKRSYAMERKQWLNALGTNEQD